MTVFKKMAALLLAVGLIVSLVGCDQLLGKDKEQEKEKTESGIDYENYTSNYSIKVKNDANQKLVAFKGAPSASTLMGGIPIGGGEHGLKRDSTLFATTGDFVLFLVTEEDYLANKDKLAVLESKPFTRLYAFYNKNSVNGIVYRISSVLGGTKKIVLQNSTNYNVELRRDGAEDTPTIGYAKSQTYNTTFYVEPDDYMVFPVFRKFNSTLNEIMTGYPVFQGEGPLKGKAWFTEFSLTGTDTVTINADDFVTGIKISAGAAFLQVQNNSGVGIRLWDGFTPQTTESGGQVINPNDSLLFPIYMNKVGNTFDPSARKEQFKIGTSAAQSQIPLPTNKTEDFAGEYIEGKIYRISVTGANANTLVFSKVEQYKDWEW